MHSVPVPELDVDRAYLARLNARDMMPLVLDLAKSRGIRLIDQQTGRRYMDFFGFYASSALGMNHPGLTANGEFLARLREAALNKITNSDIRTTHMARFLQTFDRLAIPPYMRYAFFISGGALAVENALKAAFDWKVRKNIRKGYAAERGHQVLHFREAFHGRSGYTLSLTNTSDANKVKYFPKFDWPRVINPKITFPLEDHQELVQESEEVAIRQTKQFLHERRDDIACVLIEPIQGEGGDNHFRREFLLALHTLCLENDVLLIFDEVQTGVGITGHFWAHQALGVEPDIIAFGKKTQVCGCLAGNRMDEVDDHVFSARSRINSTWGGNLVDMVRFERILEVMEEEDLVAKAAVRGAHLLGRLQDLSQEHSAIQNVRGRGLMCAFDLPSRGIRDQVLKRAFDNGLIVLGCGLAAVRFRPPLVISTEEIDEGIQILARCIDEVTQVVA